MEKEKQSKLAVYVGITNNALPIILDIYSKKLNKICKIPMVAKAGKSFSSKE